MEINVLVNGAFGKMGQETATAIEKSKEFVLVGRTGSADNLATTIQATRPTIVIDFTQPKTVYNNILTIIENNAHPVIGTTGLSINQVRELQLLCAQKKLGGIIAPNFSLGGVLMMKLAQQVARYLPAAEIIELHHPQKKDTPSGTAIKTAELIAGKQTSDASLADKPIPVMARGAQYYGIPIHSIRLPGLLANQEVIFGSAGETLKITHTTLHREAFMPGVLLACKKVVKLHELVYGLESLL